MPKDKGLDLIAWISDDEGNMLPEYQIIKKKSAVICWIPSVPGTGFTVNFSGRNKKPRYKYLDIGCRIWLDGIAVGGGVLTADERAKGIRGTVDAARPAYGDMLAFEFGKIPLTDDIGNTRAVSPDDLNTITLQLDWGKSTPSTWVPNRSQPSMDIGPIHEQQVKEGNYSSAGLGRRIPIAKPKDHLWFEWKNDESISPLIFFFHHGPADWLKAKGVIPCSPNAEAPKLNPPMDPTPEPSRGDHSGAQNHPHSAASDLETEYIDVDALSDSESKSSNSRHIKSKTPTDDYTHTLNSPPPGPEHIDIDALSDSESKPGDSGRRSSKPELLDSKPTRSCCNCNCNSNRPQTLKRPRAEPEYIDVDAFSDSELKTVTPKLEPVENKSANSYAWARKRRRPEPHIDVDAFSDPKFKSTDVKFEPADIKPMPTDTKRKPRGSRFNHRIIDSPNGEFIDDELEVSFLGCFQVTRTKTQPHGPQPNKRLKSGDDDADTKPKQELS